MAYYWLKRAERRLPALAVMPRVSSSRSPARAQPVASPTFARLVRAPDAPSAITLRVAGVVIEVRGALGRVRLAAII